MFLLAIKYGDAIFITEYDSHWNTWATILFQDEDLAQK